MPFIRNFKEKLKIQRNRALIFRPMEIVRKNKTKINNLINLIVNLVLITGCLWQIIKLFQLYLRYPTNISIETKFKSYRKALPAITLCSNIGDQSRLSTDQIFRNNSFEDYLQAIFHIEADLTVNDVNENFTQNIIESVGKLYFCFTLNSLIKCKIRFCILGFNFNILHTCIYHEN